MKKGTPNERLESDARKAREWQKTGHLWISKLRFPTQVPSATSCQRERIFSNRSFGNGPASRIAAFSWILSGFVVPTMAV